MGSAVSDIFGGIGGAFSGFAQSLSDFAKGETKQLTKQVKRDVGTVAGAVGLGKPKVPNAPIYGIDTTDDSEARDAAARAAAAEYQAGGRRATIAGGGDIAAEAQYGKGLASQQKRSQASSRLLG